MGRIEWIALDARLPEEGVEVKTKIEDDAGLRNEQTLVRKGGRWFFPDMSMYVYYTPTHWRPLITMKVPPGIDRAEMKDWAKLKIGGG